MIYYRDQLTDHVADYPKTIYHQPIPNDIYNLAIQEALELNANIQDMWCCLESLEYLEINIDNTIIEYTSEYIEVTILPAENTTTTKINKTIILYENYTTLADLLI